MKKFMIIAVAGLLAFSGCAKKQAEPAPQSAPEPKIESSVDSHGCMPSAGQSYSQFKNGCVQVFNVADVRLDDPDNKTLAVYGIFNKKKNKVEIFWASLGNESQILSKKGKKFASEDGSIQLEKAGKKYKISKK